jgi:hypothetical protein
MTPASVIRRGLSNYLAKASQYPGRAAADKEYVDGKGYFAMSFLINKDELKTV